MNRLQGKIAPVNGAPRMGAPRAQAIVDKWRRREEEIGPKQVVYKHLDLTHLIGEMGVLENRQRRATARDASDGEVEILTPTEFLDRIAGWPRAAHELAASSVNNTYLAAKRPWLQRQFPPLWLGDLPFLVGRRPVAGEGLPPWQPDLELDDAVPFRLSRNHFVIEMRNGGYHVRDLSSTLGTIVNGEPIGEHFRADDALLRAGENEVIAGGADSPFVFSVFIA